MTYRIDDFEIFRFQLYDNINNNEFMSDCSSTFLFSGKRKSYSFYINRCLVESPENHGFSTTYIQDCDIIPVLVFKRFKMTSFLEQGCVFFRSCSWKEQESGRRIFSANENESRLENLFVLGNNHTPSADSKTWTNFIM